MTRKTRRAVAFIRETAIDPILIFTPTLSTLCLRNTASQTNAASSSFLLAVWKYYSIPWYGRLLYIYVVQYEYEYCTHTYELRTRPA